MAEVGFFYNTTTQRRDTNKALIPQTNISGQPFVTAVQRGKSGGVARTGSVKSTTEDRPTLLAQVSGSGGAETDRMQDSAAHLTKAPTQTSQSAIDTSRASGASKKKGGSHQYASAAWSGSSVPYSERKFTRTTSLQRADSHNGRTNSLSSSPVTVSSSSIPAIIDTPKTDPLLEKPFIKKNGRRYLRDPTISYPLPCDLTEMHRQILRTMLLVQVMGGPVCSPNFQNKAPKKVLEVACGTAYWSSLCHQHFMRNGHSISFTGIDVAPLAPDMSENMKWTFVQHDFRKTPFPFKNEEFDLVMVKDVSLAAPAVGVQQVLTDEYLRLLSPGGVLEIWDGDHTLRMLLPHPSSTASSDTDIDDEEQERAKSTGTYTMTAQTPITAPHNQFLLDYNGWVSKALESRKLSPVPCAHIQSMLLQESESLTDFDCRRLAIPLSEVRWEREGVGGAISNDGTGQGASAKSKSNDPVRSNLSPAQAALRRTALLTVVQMIEALEPVLREASRKGQDEWDRWLGNMMNDLMTQNGTSWGECLEVGAWWATKRADAPSPATSGSPVAVTASPPESLKSKGFQNHSKTVS